MLDGTRYFASFPDEGVEAEASRALPRGVQRGTRQLASPELQDALAQLERELNAFLKAERRNRLAAAR